ncbi:MAG: endo-1,4-beta-xylanase [Burkholderiales bacterium]|nr:endo-1,4-beta-xylanase [Burkholderiales bacterium]
MTLTRRQALGSLLAASVADLPAARAAEEAAAFESLDAIAQRKGLRFGSAIGARKNDSDQVFGFHDRKYRDLLARECGVMVPENELKWRALRPSAERFDFTQADAMLAWAREQNLLVRGHTLLWHPPQWLPDWLNRHDFGARPAQAAERLLSEHVSTVCRRYGDAIGSWDVVNESVHPDTGELRVNAFTQPLGNVEQIDLAFRVARENAPRAQLVYNDFMSWGGGNAAKHRAGVLRLLRQLKARGTPVDALGLQSHLGTGQDGQPVAPGSPQEHEWRDFLDEATAMGLDLLITELDVSDRYLSPDIARRDAEVAALARADLDLTLSYPRLRTLMVWGLADNLSWLQNRSPRPDGLAKRPCPYDAQLRPKALRAALADALRAMPARA